MIDASRDWFSGRFSECFNLLKWFINSKREIGRPYSVITGTESSALVSNSRRPVHLPVGELFSSELGSHGAADDPFVSRVVNHVKELRLLFDFL
jgi:hypothetical protein